MADNSANISGDAYLNPVYPRSFPDPYVIKFRGEYYAYCTDFWRDGRVFGVLRSRDLVNWTEVGGAMKKLDGDAPFYWAPEVIYADGKFYLYYSVGNETLMELRVAVSDRPDGGFVDSGRRLTNEDFAIDGHVFIDTDGQKYFFYATDFLEHTHIGTGTVVDRMIDFLTLEGRPRPVVRAKYDWQVYDPARQEKGGVRWHTVEGPFILKRKGIYYEMFSGGNWQNITYGVSFAVTDDIARDEEWTQFSDGEKVLPVLRTIPDLVVGPGHNSVVRGPNNRELYCAYHRWTEPGRTLSIDRQDFAGTRIFIKGATHTPQKAPFAPTGVDFFDDAELNKNWQKVGDWHASDNEAVNEIAEKSLLICTEKSESFLCEFTLRALETTVDESAFGFCLLSGSEKTFEMLLAPRTKEAIAIYAEAGKIQEKRFDLPKTFNPSAFHLMRVEADGLSLRIAIDEANFRFEKLLENASTQIAFVAEKMRAGFSGFALTAGFEDLFDWPDAAQTEKRGWEMRGPAGATKLAQQALTLSAQSGEEASIVKGALSVNFEFAVNIRFQMRDGAFAGFAVCSENGEIAARVSLAFSGDRHHLVVEDENEKFPLPESFAPENFHQFRFTKTGDKISIALDETDLGEFNVPAAKARIGLFARAADLDIEAARLTVL